MPVKVSVIVPVYNPGPYVEDLISSLLRQSLPSSEFEAVFVDDGSTDDTPARLDALMAEHPHLRVIHQENSGWSGKPRNVGIEAAQGDYVFFADNDDWLGDEALSRMYDFAVKNGSDVVIGKMAGVNRGVPRELFRRSYDNATLDNAPLIDSLTPHKMFRRAFLNENGLRYPEGRRRLEDHVFVIGAFFAAKRISVLSDYVCYYHIRREDASNAGFQSIDPKGYFANLSEALDIVRDNTEPGALRDKLYRRWLRVEMVERLRGSRLLRMEPAERWPLFDEIRRVMEEYFGPGVAAGLPAIQQLITALVRSDDLDELLKLSAWEAGIAGRVRLDDIAWRAGTVELAFTAGLVADGEPMRFVRRDDRELFAPPLDATLLEGLPAQTLDVTQRLKGSRVDLLVKERSSHAEYFQPVTFQLEKLPAAGPEGSPDDGFHAELSATVRLD
ncbi:glycosyltransferase family 2 protein, partial [Flindersiella endophytica]